MLMDALIIEKTGDTPKIVLDANNNIFEISDRSLPENANGFFEPVFTWLSEYAANPNATTKFVFSLEYFNTSSAKQIAKILLILEKLSKTNDVSICWQYKTDDNDMMAAGERYSKLLNMQFNLVAV